MTLQGLTCACGKRGYFTRKEAKRVARRIYPGDSALNAYRCLGNPKFFHLGHLREQVRHGEVDRSIYGKAGSA